MKINRLDLTRFGPFTDKSFDFSKPGVHVIVGNNEAGKTVSMAAIRNLMFGIDVQTAYDFVHKKPDLLLGAQLEDASGQKLEIARVKKRSDTLRGGDGRVLDEAVLAKYLHGIDEDVFANLFTVGHDEIAEGGAQLLDGDGELGRAIFSASRGTTDLTAVIRTLDSRANDIFKKSGSKPELNAAIRRYKDDSAAAAAVTMSAATVLELDTKLAAAQSARDELATSRKLLAERRALLERVRSTRGLLVNQREFLSVRSELEAQGLVVDRSTGGDLQEAQERRSQARSAILTAESEIERLTLRLGELNIDVNLLEQQEVIEKLTRDSGGYDQNEKDLPGLKAKANTLKQDLAQRRRRLPQTSPLGEKEYSGLAVNDEQRIEQLASDHPELSNDLRHAVQEVEETKRNLVHLSEDLARLGELTDVSVLEAVLARIRTDGDLETSRSERTQELSAIDAGLSADLILLGLSDTDVRSVATVAVPSIETIRKERHELDQRVADIARLEEQASSLASQSEAAGQELAQLMQDEEPPSAGDLLESRSNRDEGWRHIRAVWLGSQSGDDESAHTAWAGHKPLQDAYEEAVSVADGLADQLHNKASAVQRRASLDQLLVRLASDLEALSNNLSDRLLAKDKAESEWVLLWEPAGISPQPPQNMEVWFDDYRACMQRSDEARAIEGTIQALDTTIARHSSDLGASLSAVGKSLPEGLSLLGLLQHAEQKVAIEHKAQQVRSDATAAHTKEEALLRKRATTHDRAQMAIHTWQNEWSTALSVIGLAATASTGEAGSVLEALREISETGAALEDLQRRIFGITERSQNFTDGVAAVLDALQNSVDLEDELVDADAAAAAKMLERRVKEARSIAAKSKVIVEEREGHHKLIADAQVGLAQADNAINEMIVLTGVSTESELSAAIVRGEDHSKIIEQLNRAENDLRGVAGKPLKEIEAEIAELEGVEIEPDIQQLDLDLEALDIQIRERQTTVGELSNQRSLIGPSRDAADLATTAQQSLSAIADYADQYVQIVLARRLLEEHVNAYRDENQGPLLERASKLFNALTLGRYSGLDTDADAKGTPFLMACHSDKKLLDVAALSTGTRDQLYLALRLSALEQFMARRGPLPIVFDDLFVQFDDERTKAGLQVLDVLADKTQVLVFTHHAEIANQAAQVIDSSRLNLHTLA